jgi:hypothetical protein
VSKVINIRDHGAVGDAHHDDLPSVADAIRVAESDIVEERPIPSLVQHAKFRVRAGETVAWIAFVGGSLFVLGWIMLLVGFVHGC